MLESEQSVINNSAALIFDETLVNIATSCTPPVVATFDIDSELIFDETFVNVETSYILLNLTTAGSLLVSKIY